MDNFRMLGYYCYAPHLQKPLTPQKFLGEIWPSPRDAEEKQTKINATLERARREYDNIKRN